MTMNTGSGKSPMHHLWSITIQNDTEHDATRLSWLCDSDGRLLWIGYQSELAPTTGTRHIQMYAWTVIPTTFANARKIFTSKGSKRALGLNPSGQDWMVFAAGKDKGIQYWIDYTSKEDSRCPELQAKIMPFQRKYPDRLAADELTHQQWFKSALKGSAKAEEKHVLHRMLDKGMTYDEMLSDPVGFRLMNKSGAKQFVEGFMASKRRRKEPDTNVKIYWIHGGTGTGKTKCVYDYVKTHYATTDEPGGLHELFSLMPPNNKAATFFDGYHGQYVALIDEMSSQTMPWKNLLRVLDIYPLTVNIKGSSVAWCPKIIFLTSAVHPRKIFPLQDEDGQIEQLMRRITEVKCTDPEDEPMDTANPFGPGYTTFDQQFSP